MDAIEVIEIIERATRRVCRDRSNPFEIYTNDEFKQRFPVPQTHSSFTTAASYFLP